MRGFPPSRRVCVEINTTEKGETPFSSHLWWQQTTTALENELCVVFEGGGLVAAVSTTLENEHLSSFLWAVVGGVPVK